MKVIDPHAVVVSCLKHATSVACNILLIGCAVSVEQEQVESLGLIENL
jgi:chaperonin GroEL (HSP60 family)